MQNKRTVKESLYILSIKNIKFVIDFDVYLGDATLPETNLFGLQNDQLVNLYLYVMLLKTVDRVCSAIIDDQAI